MTIPILATVMGVLMSMGYYPQAWRIFKNKSAEDVSLLAYAIFSAGTLTWLLYGIYLGDVPIIVSFVLGVGGSWLVFCLTVFYRYIRPRQAPPTVGQAGI